MSSGRKKSMEMCDRGGAWGCVTKGIFFYFQVFFSCRVKTEEGCDSVDWGVQTGLAGWKIFGFYNYY